MVDDRRSIPRTDHLLEHEQVATAVQRLGRELVKSVIKSAQDQARAGRIEPTGVIDAVLAALPPNTTSLREAVNATGVIIHTNLGRAPLSDAARQAIVAASGTTTVELDLVTGRRARRGRGTLDALATAVPAAEAVHVVNNNAAALLLCSAVLAAGREIILSRGEHVEIGDGFRIHELLTASGARIREVGATNRTSITDYERAIGPDTGFVLKVHPSNFQVNGFTAEAGVSELSRLPVPVVVDIGSGLLTPHPLLPAEPDASSALAQGAALVTASGDKLLGGPQAGLLFGREALIERLRRHPMARALRVDKLTLAALEATLRGPISPVQAALTASPEVLETRAVLMADRLRAAGVDAIAISSRSTVGGGAAPGVEFASWAVSLPASFADWLRTAAQPVVGRLTGHRCLLDLRTVPPEDDGQVESCVLAVYESCTS